MARAEQQRGAVIVEVAFVLPLLMILVLGLVELGFVIRDTQTVVAASQSAARVASSSGDSRLADHDALATVAAALAEVDVADVERIIVFRPEADGSMSANCEAAAFPGECNHYDGNDLNLAAASFTGTTSCGVGSPDIDWCPIGRETRQSLGPDWIGIRVEVRHISNAPFIGDQTISDTTVMRLEPRFES
jgi:hypothetical protein